MSKAENFVKDYSEGKECDAIEALKGMNFRNIMETMNEARKLDSAVSLQQTPFQHSFTLTESGLNPITITEIDKLGDGNTQIVTNSNCGEIRWDARK